MKRPVTSLANRFKLSGLLINNALASQEVINILSNYKFHQDYLLILKKRYEEAIKLNELQKKSYGDQHQATYDLTLIKSQAEKVYKATLKIARIVFKDQSDASEALLLDGPRKRSVFGFLEQACTFYNNLLKDQKLIAAISNYNYNLEKLLAERELVNKVALAFENQQRDRGKALQSTKDRNLKLDLFEKQIAELSVICKIALADRIDLLTSLGLQ